MRDKQQLTAVPPWSRCAATAAARGGLRRTSLARYFEVRNSQRFSELMRPRILTLVGTATTIAARWPTNRQLLRTAHLTMASRLFLLYHERDHYYTKPVHVRLLTMRWTSWARRAAPGVLFVGAISRCGRRHAASLDESQSRVARRSTLLLGCGSSQAPERPGAWRLPASPLLLSTHPLPSTELPQANAQQQRAHSVLLMKV